MVGKLTTLFIALAVPCVAQDFEPDRRPEEGLFLFLPIGEGVMQARSTHFTTAPTVAASYPGQTVTSTDGGHLSLSYYSSSGVAPYNYADRPEWRTRPLTMSVWYRNLYTGTGGENTRFFGNAKWSGSDNIGYVMFLDDGWTGHPAPYSNFIVGLGNGGALTAYTDTAPAGDTWRHLLVSVNNSGSASAYIDGNLLGTLPGTFCTAATAFPLYIGGSNVNTGGCDIDDIRVWAGRSLSASEAYAVYLAGRHGTQRP